MLMFTLSDIGNHVQFENAKAVCGEFWLDVRREGVTPEQRRDIFIGATASGHLKLPVSAKGSVQLSWTATLCTASLAIKIAPCEQNPGVHPYGPVSILSHSNKEADVVCEMLLDNETVSSSIRAAISRELALEVPIRLFQLASS